MIFLLAMWIIAVCILGRETEANARQRIKYQEWKRAQRAANPGRNDWMVYAVCLVALPFILWMMVAASSR